MLGTYERNKSKIAVKCDICGWEWTPIPYSLLKGHGCPKCARVKQKTHAEFVEELQSQRDDVVLIGRSLLRISLVAGDVQRVHSLVEEHPSV